MEQQVNQSARKWVRGPVLGRGSYGCVRMAYVQTKKNSPPLTMAVKSAWVSVSAEFASWERKVLEALQGSPFIIQCYGEDITVAGDGRSLVSNLFLEYASGGSLASFIQNSPRCCCCRCSGNNGGSWLPEVQVRLFTESILRGVEHIHKAGFIHCDLKPENVLLVSQETGGLAPKIADFGLAKRAAVNGGNNCPVRGTLMYLSPEAVAYGVQGQPADIWAVGCVVLCMLTGKLPWESKKQAGGSGGRRELKLRIVGEVPAIPSGVSRMARDFLSQCFVRNPAERPTAEALLRHPFVSLQLLMTEIGGGAIDTL